MKRNRRAGVADRWHKTVYDADGTARTVPSAAYGKGKRWRARYVDDTGREYTKLFGRKTDAETWLANDIVPALATGTHVAPSAGRVTVAQVYQSWVVTQGHVSAKTAASRRSTWGSRVEPQWGDAPVVDVRTAAVRAWVAAMVTDGVGVPTIENAYGLLRQVLSAAVEDRRIPRNPCEGIKLPKRKHADRGYLSHAQVGALAAAVNRHPEVIRFLAYTGLRWGEMAALRVRLRHAAPASERQPLRHRIGRPGVVDTQDMGAAVGAIPGRAGTRAGGAHGGQGPRGHGVHRPAGRRAAELQLPVPGV
ncbi:tyrosine-type recombinase/integrase [Mycobacterium intracellulare]|uniref:tyrosine-type recombinase/integrase n=1 Tax=Mycobacterium intracellulare TaxID=1767 RepID=UPI0039F44B1B